MTFDYLIDKIRMADFTACPFRHIHIADFFSDDHFAAITGSPDINLPPASSDANLFDTLFSSGYKIIDFPGCVTDKDQYMRWRRARRLEHGVTNTACEGFGMTLRLLAPKTPIIAALHDFLTGEAFRDAIAEKFAIDLGLVFADSGIQKYLDGYEISPHPDIRKKALTYMVNINPHTHAENLDHHTHYLRFKPSYKYIQAFWEGNPDQDRCWVPWSWCESAFQQTKNNSLVIFSPGDDTIHGVKARYDHLAAQRTQLYGNLWFHHVPVDGSPRWEDLAIVDNVTPRKATTVERLKSLVPPGAKDFVKRAAGKTLNDPNVIRDRLKSR